MSFHVTSRKVLVFQVSSLSSSASTQKVQQLQCSATYSPTHRPNQKLSDTFTSSLTPMAGGRKAKLVPPSRPTTTLVVDNGASTLKYGIIHDGVVNERRIVPNLIARDRSRKIYVASELSKCQDLGEVSFRRPVEKGYIVNWEAQKEIWDREIFNPKSSYATCDPTETRLILTEPPNNLPALQANCDQIVFEEYGFASYYRGLGKCALRIHSGYWTTCSIADSFQGPPSMHTMMCKIFSAHQGRLPL